MLQSIKMQDLLNQYQQLSDTAIWGNTVHNYVLGVSLFIVLVFSFKIFRSIILRRAKALAAKTTTLFDDELVKVFEHIHPSFYNLVALYFGLKYLSFPESADKIINGIFITIVIFQLILSSQELLCYILAKILKLDRERDEDKTAFNGINLVIRIVLWSTGALLLLSNLGFNISSLAASLGIGGIAVALAVQNILGDIFSSFSIYFDKPFVIGDFIIVGTDMGTVKKIGLKTTRIQTLQGEELVISNKELTSARIQNFKKMEKRRVVFALGVTYDTTLEQCKKIPEIVKSIYENVTTADLDRVHFKEFGNFSLNYEIVYYQHSGDFTAYMDTRQEINFQLKEEFEKAGIEFAFPSQTIYLEKTN